MTFKYVKIVNGPFVENCYLLYDSASMDGILIDPGDEPGKILGVADKNRVNVKAVYNTHGHIDHAGAADEICKKLKIPFALHKGDEKLVGSLSEQANMFGFTTSLKSPEISIFLEDNQIFKVGDQDVKVIHTPGHTKGGVCFLAGNFIFAGDTLFAGSIGRSDLPGGDGRELIQSIKKRLMVLDDNIKVFSGHGPETTIGREKMYNPYLG
ncbi:MAG: MBL fold metallo-hydrolase [Deltaproteobacteria bacterium]|nr:MBL fold metallo-hydrolase [Deltaproteobacteria bacterium]